MAGSSMTTSTAVPVLLKTSARKLSHACVSYAATVKNVKNFVPLTVKKFETGLIARIEQSKQIAL
jgi:hypothetical protein